MNRLLSILFIIIALSSCDQQSKAVAVNSSDYATDDMHPMDRLSNDKAGEVVRKAIEFAGGWEVWEQKNNFSFYKNIPQLDSTGATIKNERQLHQYNLDQGFQGRMTWDIGDDQYIIINNGNQAKKYKNNDEMTDEHSKKIAWNSSFGSNYVISMPFKLTDPGVILTYDGIDSTTVGRAVHGVKVEYEKGAGSSGGYHTWWYYFDVKNYDLAANFLDYGNGYSLTTYETFAKVGDLRIHLKRFSYVSNDQKEKVMLKTIYENEEMQFNSRIDKSTFQLL